MNGTDAGELLTRLGKERARWSVGCGMTSILLAVHSANSGGAQLMALADARHLSRSFKLTISVPDGSLRADFADAGEIIAPCRPLPIWGASPVRWGLQAARNLADAVRLARVIRQRKIRAVLVNSTVLLGPVLAARLAGVPAIVHAREFPMTRGGRAVFWLHGRLASTVIAVSQAVADRFPRGGRARFVKIPDGIEIPPPPPPARNGFHTPLRLCVIGGLNGGRSKGQDVALAALGKLADRGVDASLHLVGPIVDDDFAEELRRTAQRLGITDRLRIVGESRAIDDVIAATDIIVHPSRIEPLGLVPAEALVRGRPVIAARTGGLPEVVRDGVTGVLVTPDDPTELSAAIARLAADPAEARAMVARGRADVAERFAIERCLESLQAETERAVYAETGPNLVRRRWKGKENEGVQKETDDAL